MVCYFGLCNIISEEANWNLLTGGGLTYHKMLPMPLHMQRCAQRAGMYAYAGQLQQHGTRQPASQRTVFNSYTEYKRTSAKSALDHSLSKTPALSTSLVLPVCCPCRWATNPRPSAEEKAYASLIHTHCLSVILASSSLPLSLPPSIDPTVLSVCLTLLPISLLKYCIGYVVTGYDSGQTTTSVRSLPINLQLVR